MTDLVVIKKDGSKELYDQDKLKRALIIAFGKKNISTEQIDEIISRLEANWSGKIKEITSKQVGQDVLALLKNENEVAYVRFASVFMEFEGITDFEQIMKEKS